MGRRATGARRGKGARSVAIINAAIEILQEIQPASVRAVCYQLFTRRILGSMSKIETNRVSKQLTWAREQGYLPWAWIVDETRDAERVSAWENPAACVETVQRAYRRDRWSDQPAWIEVWSEKGTIRGTLAPILNDYGLTFRVMHSYTSATTAFSVARESMSDSRNRVLQVFYLGDCDPSGMHMSEVDLPRRLNRYRGDVIIRRLALEQGDCTDALPWFPVESKIRDARFGWYWRRYGSRCWELDALSPVLLRQRVEKAERESLIAILSGWPGISRQASNCDNEAPQ
jgi:hypothetical protein